MACEQYQSWVADAAVGNLGVEQEKEWRLHLNACAACRESLAQERFLLAAIERGLEARFAASEPSPAFLARVRTSVAENSGARKAGRWLRQWSLPVAGAFAVIALSFWIAHRPGIYERPPVGTRPKEVVSPSAQAQQQVIGTRNIPAQIPLLQKRRQYPTVAKALRSSGELEPRVIVPMDEEAGLARLYYSLQRRPVLSSAVLSDSGEDLKLLSISPLEIAPLEVSESEDSVHLPDAGRSR